jgi:hypothetical protein
VITSPSKHWNTRPSYTSWDEALNNRVNNVSNCLNSTDPKCLISERAYTRLCDLMIHDKIRHGDIINTLRDYGILDPKEYRRMQKRLSRIKTNTTDQSVSRSQIKPPDQPVEVHGDAWWAGKLRDLALVEGLPWRGRGNRGWHGIVTPSVTFEVYKDGSYRVFDHEGDWQLTLAKELQACGWSDDQIGGLFEDMRFHGQSLHIAERKPGVQKGLIWQSKDGNEKELGDSTPRHDTHESVVDSLTHLFKKIDAMPDMIPVVLHRYLGGKTPMLILAQMEGQMIKMQDDQMRMHGELSDLKQLNGLNHLSAPSLNTADGPPSLGATEPLSKGSPESAGTLSLHSPPAFLGNNKSQQAIQLSVTKAPDTGEPSETSLGQQTPSQEVSSRSAIGARAPILPLETKDLSAQQMMAQDMGINSGSSDHKSGEGGPDGLCTHRDGELAQDDASPKARTPHPGLISSDHQSGEWSRNRGIEPGHDEELKRDDVSLKAGAPHLDLGLTFKEGYARTAGVEPPTESATAPSTPQSKRCPKCREYGLSMVYCGDILVCYKGEPMVYPFRCFKDFVNCIRYQNGGQGGGYSNLVATRGNEIKRSMGFPTRRYD